MMADGIDADIDQIVAETPVTLEYSLDPGDYGPGASHAVRRSGGVEGPARRLVTALVESVTIWVT
jgi:hypothetical protein